MGIFEQKVEHLGKKLKTLDLKILLSVQRHPTNKQLSKWLKKPKSTISDHTKKLLKLGFLTKPIKSAIHIFELTQKGKNLCSTILAGGKPKEYEIKAHHLLYVSEIVRAPKELSEKLLNANWSETNNNTWKGYKSRMHECTIIFTPKTVQFYLPWIWTKSSEKSGTIYGKATELVQKLKYELEDTYHGLVLGKPSEIATVRRQELAIEFDPLAIEYWKHNQENNVSRTYESDRIKIDASEGIPETETHNKVFAGEDLDLITQNYEDIVRHNIRIKDFGEILRENTSILEHLATQNRDFYKQFGTYVTGNTPIMNNVLRIIENNEKMLGLEERRLDLMENMMKEIRGRSKKRIMQRIFEPLMPRKPKNTRQVRISKFDNGCHPNQTKLNKFSKKKKSNSD